MSILGLKGPPKSTTTPENSQSREASSSSPRKRKSKARRAYVSSDEEERTEGGPSASTSNRTLVDEPSIAAINSSSTGHRDEAEVEDAVGAGETEEMPGSEWEAKNEELEADPQAMDEFHQGNDANAGEDQAGTSHSAALGNEDEFDDLYAVEDDQLRSSDPSEKSLGKRPARPSRLPSLEYPQDSNPSRQGSNEPYDPHAEANARLIEKLLQEDEVDPNAQIIASMMQQDEYRSTFSPIMFNPPSPKSR